MRSGDSFTQLVQFDTGFPDANVAWTLLDGNGATVATGTITPAGASVSVVITVAGSNNTLSGGNLYGDRELRWSYTVGGVAISDSVRYRVVAFLKFGVSEKGVRTKLGVEEHEVDNIDLVGAYSIFQDTVTQTVLDAVTSPSVKLAVCDAIEALAALKLLPSLQVKLAGKEASGTDQFQRGKINWDNLFAQLNQLVAAGYTAVDPTLDPAANFGSIFSTVVRSDPVVGDDV